MVPSRVTRLYHVMMTVGRGILPLTPVGAFVSVIAHSVVLFLFSSVELQHFLITNGLPAIPLIPVSSSQAIVGAVIGIALLKGLRGLKQIQWSRVGGIVLGWIVTPIAAGAICFFSLFIMQNVFDQSVYTTVKFELSAETLEHLGRQGLAAEKLEPLRDTRIASGAAFLYQVKKYLALNGKQEQLVLGAAKVVGIDISPEALATLDAAYLGVERTAVVRALAGRQFDRRWQLENALVQEGEAWRTREALPINQRYNKERRQQLDYVFEHFRTAPGQD